MHLTKDGLTVMLSKAEFDRHLDAFLVRGYKRTRRGILDPAGTRYMVEPHWDEYVMNPGVLWIIGSSPDILLCKLCDDYGVRTEQMPDQTIAKEPCDHEPK